MACHNANPNPLVEGPMIRLPAVHAKVRRAGVFQTAAALTQLARRPLSWCAVSLSVPAPPGWAAAHAVMPGDGVLPDRGMVLLVAFGAVVLLVWAVGAPFPEEGP